MKRYKTVLSDDSFRDVGTANPGAAPGAVTPDAQALIEARRQADWNAGMLARTEALCRSGSMEMILPDGTVKLSDGLRAMLGLPADHLGTTIEDLLCRVPDDERPYVEGIWRAAIPGEPFEFEHRIEHQDGRRLVVLHRGLIVVGPPSAGNRLGVALLQDITEQRAAEQRALQATTHDPRTGLPNRAALFEHMEAALHCAQRGERAMAVLACEVARLAEVREMMGFSAGDRMADAIAARIREACGPGEFVARVGDTEFTVLVEDAGRPGNPADVVCTLRRAEQLKAIVEQVVRVQGAEVFPRCVVGVATYPHDADCPQELLACAQKARLKATGQDGVCAFEANSNARAIRDMQIEASLRGAIERNELALHYQPQVDLSTGRITAAEALLRWDSAELGPVGPDEFISIAERSGLIAAIGSWVLRRACEQSVAWRREGLPVPRINVNLSPAQLEDPRLPDELQQLLLETGADPAHLGVELTESTAMADQAHAAALLRRIRTLGIEIALDDFGTGFSSLSSLRSLPIDVVKVDRSFVHDVTASAEDVSVTRAIIKMAHGLQLQVVAEGVETDGQLSLLAATRCNRMQGYWFSPPVLPDDFAAMLRAGKCLPERFMTRVRRTRTLLLVDDEENILSALKRLFRRDGYHVITAQGAAEALQRMAETEVDVVVSDQRMPAMTGVELLRRAKELYPDSVRIVLSGYTELQSILDAVNEGAIYKFLTKPWDDQRLREHVAEAFRRKEMADENRRLAQEIEKANADFVSVNSRLEAIIARQRERARLLADSADQLRDVLHALPAPIVGIDGEGTICFANESANALFDAGMPLPGRNVREVMPAPMLSALGTGGRGARVSLGDRGFLLHCRMLPDPDSAGIRLAMLVPDSHAETV